ncbi:MAG: alpha-galactosidase [Mogibacterium sp.]|nr:alpha-galactosidase [Mogibacterium sp.]
MSILFNDKEKTFTIHTAKSTYQMKVDSYGFLLHLYYGRRTDGCMDYILTYADRGMSGCPYDAGTVRTYSLDALPQEFPVLGTGDFRSPALIVRDQYGAYECDPRYSGYEITEGKYSLKGLPAVYADAVSDKAETLKIFLHDEHTGLDVTLLYGVLPELDIITRSAVVTNNGDKTVTVCKLHSACLDFVSGDFDTITFCGRHAMERVPERQRLGRGAHRIGSRRGASSHQYNPFMILADSSATETSGRCWGMQFVYSGGFAAEAELDQYGQTRIQMGLQEDKFSYPLNKGESLTAPEVIMTYSGAGIEALTHNYHKCLRDHICRGKYKNAERPVLLNSWEASYFTFTGDSICALAHEAAELGIDMLVLDDGWFGIRNNDYSGLGDWNANEDKLGCTLSELIRRVNAEGVRFGIWMEPEMVNEESDLYRKHPDWALRIPGKDPVRGRYQLVLDLSRKDVCDWMYESICSVLDQGNIEYLKWDYNRSITDVYSHTASDQGKVLYDYMIGLYDVLEKLNSKYPDLLIEGCSGGGGRFDAGMLYYTPQIWCSDNTDAIDRLTIQYGTSFGYPSCTVGAHVSACPNHQTGRTTPFATRAAVAMSGTFGYELDPAKLSPSEKAEIKEQIKVFKDFGGLIRSGDHYRLSDPARDICCAWEYVSEDKSRALVTAVVKDVHGNMTSVYVRPRGLEPGAEYKMSFVCGSGKAAPIPEIVPADALMEAGFPLPTGFREYDSFVWVLDRI